MVELPFNYDNKMDGECFSFYRFSIMNTKPEISMPWYATKTNFYIGTNMRKTYGGYGTSEGRQPEISWYNDVLTQKEIPVESLDETNFIQSIKALIDIGFYVIVYMDNAAFYNYRFVFPEDRPEHEQCIYGYDDDKQVFILPMIGKGNVFERTEVPYQWALNGFLKMKERCIENPNKPYHHRGFYFEVTAIKVNPNYECPNLLFEHCRKMDNDYFARVSHNKVAHRRGKNTLEEYDTYTGLAVYEGIKSAIDFMIANKDDIETFKRDRHNILRAIKNLYDYKEINVRSMRYVLDKFKVNGPSDKLISDLIDEYAASTKKFKNACYIYLKWEKNEDPILIEQIKKICDECYETESHSLDWYGYRLRQYLYLDKSKMKQ